MTFDWDQSIVLGKDLSVASSRISNNGTHCESLLARASICSHPACHSNDGNAALLRSFPFPLSGLGGVVSGSSDGSVVMVEIPGGGFRNSARFELAAFDPHRYLKLRPMITTT